MIAAMSTLSPFHLTNKIRKPVVSFQYADDTVMVTSAKGSTIRMLLLLMHCFTAASGLTVNFAKSSFVPLFIPHHHIPSVEQLLGCKRQSFPILYLGMPLSIKSPTREDFAPLVDRLESRLQEWKASFISRAGKLLLVKAVLSSIPTYFMSCFALPKWLTDRIDKIRRQFLWSRIQTQNPIHLINWQIACLHVKNSGLGILNLRLQNTSLLLRWWWRLYAADRKLWCTYATLIYARQRPTAGPLILSSDGSFFWKALNKIKPIFHSSIRYRLISGRNISFWHDAWSGQPLSTDFPTSLPQRSISVFHATSIIHRLLPSPLTIQQTEAAAILRSFSPTNGSDKIIWQLTSSGNFSVSSIYKILSQLGKTRSSASSAWKARVRPTMSFFFFLLLHNRLLTHDVMQRRNLAHTPGCVMCMTCPTETAMHLFFRCSFARSIWDTLSVAAGYTVMNPTETPLLTYLASAPTDKERRKKWMVTFITATHIIWTGRNARIFRNSSTAHFVLAVRILQDSALYLQTC